MQDTLKTLSISLCSSICTALLVVACTAGADKLDDDDDDWDNDGTSETAPPDVGFGGDDGDGLSSEELAELTATVAAQQEAIVALEEFQASSLCFIGHMMDGKYWQPRIEGADGYPGYWIDIEDLHYRWNQGPNSDAQEAYDDCF